MARRRLAVDWPACKAHGVCAELLPEIVQLDEWGYPVVAPGPVPPGVRRYAQRAVSACPTLALRLVPWEPPQVQAPPPASESAPGPRTVSRRSLRAAERGVPAAPPAAREAEPLPTRAELRRRDRRDDDTADDLKPVDAPRRRARRSS